VTSLSMHATQYAFSLRAAIERGCSIWANHAQTCQLTSSDLKTGRVAKRPLELSNLPMSGFPRRGRPDHRGSGEDPDQLQ
jgi:hypothetical protein